MKVHTSIVVAVVACAASLVSLSTLAAEAAAKDVAAAKATAEAKNYKPLAEARAKIGEVIEDPAKMTEVMKTLSPEDQKAFVADVNAAISKMPGSVEDKTAKYLNVNKAALRGASEGNMANVLAATFASVPPESLTVISERYANDLFNRDAGAANKMPDPVFEKTAKEVIGKVCEATTGSDDSGVRNTLAVLMFVRADNGQIEGLADRLADTIPDSQTRELAKTEWIPAAMATGENKSYDSMLAYADAGKAPDLNIVLNLAGPQVLEAVTVDITSGMLNYQGIATTPVLDQAFGGFDEPRAYITDDDTTGMTAGNAGTTVPRTADPTKPWNPEYKRGDSNVPHDSPEPEVKPEPEPKPYPYSEL